MNARQEAASERWREGRVQLSTEASFEQLCKKKTRNREVQSRVKCRICII